MCGTRRKLASHFCLNIKRDEYNSYCFFVRLRIRVQQKLQQYFVQISHLNIRVALCVYDCCTAVLLFRAVREGCRMICSSCCCCLCTPRILIARERAAVPLPRQYGLKLMVADAKAYGDFAEVIGSRWKLAEASGKEYKKL